jgi:hypothetical protein
MLMGVAFAIREHLERVAVGHGDAVKAPRHLIRSVAAVEAPCRR